MEDEKEGMLLGQVCCAKAVPRLGQGWAKAGPRLEAKA